MTQKLTKSHGGSRGINGEEAQALIMLAVAFKFFDFELGRFLMEACEEFNEAEKVDEANKT